MKTMDKAMIKADIRSPNMENMEMEDLVVTNKEVNTKTMNMEVMDRMDIMD